MPARPWGGFGVGHFVGKLGAKTVRLVIKLIAHYPRTNDILSCYSVARWITLGWSFHRDVRPQTKPVIGNNDCLPLRTISRPIARLSLRALNGFEVGHFVGKVGAKTVRLVINLRRTTSLYHNAFPSIHRGSPPSPGVNPKVFPGEPLRWLDADTRKDPRVTLNNHSKGPSCNVEQPLERTLV